MAPGQTKFLGAIYAFGATLSFTVAHVSVIRLRKLHPIAERAKLDDGDRAWKPPGSVRIRGVEVPLTAVLGGLGTFGAFIVAMVARSGDPRHRRWLDARRARPSTSSTAAARGCR